MDLTFWTSKSTVKRIEEWQLVTFTKILSSVNPTFTWVCGRDYFENHPIILLSRLHRLYKDRIQKTENIITTPYFPWPSRVPYSLTGLVSETGPFSQCSLVLTTRPAKLWWSGLVGNRSQTSLYKVVAYHTSLIPSLIGKRHRICFEQQSGSWAQWIQG